MSCCGKQREKYQTTGQAQRGTNPGNNTFVRPKSISYANAYFQYLGHTGLTVMGAITGKRYRFDQGGAVVSVDPRDRRSIAAVPKLRQIAHP